MDRKAWIALIASPLVALSMFGINSCHSAWQRQEASLRAVEMRLEAVDTRLGIMVESDRREMEDIKRRLEDRR